MKILILFVLITKINTQIDIVLKDKTVSGKENELSIEVVQPWIDFFTIYNSINQSALQ